MKKIIWFLGIISSMFFLSCDKDKKSTKEEELVPVTIKIFHEVDGEELQLNSKEYKTPLDYSYTVSVFKYYFTNVEFIKTDGTIYTVPQDSSYFLVDEKKPDSKNITIHIPQGEYSAVRFLIGVDSLRNTKDISERKGTLDPAGDALGMYWGWNSGYIHFILEGHSPDIPIEMVGTQNFVFHIGGFGGYSTPTINNIKQITIDLNEKGNLKSSNLGISELTLSANINMVFRNKETGNDVDFTTTPSFMFDSKSTILSDNYQYMFSHHSTNNK